MNALSFFALFSSMIFFGLAAQNQDVVVSGVVTGESTQEGLAGAAIYVVELERGVVTDESGYYEIELQPGNYTFQFSFLGKRTIEKEISIDSARQLNVSLSALRLQFDDIIVEGFDSDVLRRRAIGAESINVADLRQLPTVLAEADIIHTLETLPGVQSVGEGASGFHVRGGRADQNLILMNGAVVYNPSHVLGLYSIFNPDYASDFTLYKGHIPAQYGGRLSSVLDVNLRKGPVDDYKVRGGAGLISSRVLIEGPIREGRSSFIMGGRGAWSEILFTFMGKHRQLMSMPVPREVYDSNAYFYEGFATFYKKLNNYNTLEASYFGSRDYFQYADRYGYAWNNRTGSVRWQNIVSDDFITQSTLSLSSYSSENFTPSGTDAFLLSSGITHLDFSQGQVYDGIENHSLTFGLSATLHITHDETMEPNSFNSLVEKQRVGKGRGLDLSAYIDDLFRVSDNLDILTGIRISRYTQMGPAEVFSYADDENRTLGGITDTTRYDNFEEVGTFTRFEPRVAAKIHFGDYSFSMSYNRMHQFIHQITNTAAPTPADTWQGATSYLPPQRADSYAVGLSRNFPAMNLNASADIFYRRMANLVEYRDFADLYVNPHIETELLSGVGRAYGGEVSLVKSAGRWTGWMSYSYIRSWARAPDLSINNGDWFPANFDQPHDLSLILKRRVGEASAVSLNFNYKTGRPITANEGLIFDSASFIPLFSERNKYRVPDYIRLDLSITIAENIWKDRVVDPDRRIEDSMTFSFYNILGRKNAFSVFYQLDGQSIIPKSYKLSVFGALIPSVTYNFRF